MHPEDLNELGTSVLFIAGYFVALLAIALVGSLAIWATASVWVNIAATLAGGAK